MTESVQLGRDPGLGERLGDASLNLGRPSGIQCVLSQGQVHRDATYTHSNEPS